MLEHPNKCCLCKQKLHPKWWNSWGFWPQYDDIKQLAKDLNLDSTKEDMFRKIKEATQIGLHFLQLTDGKFLYCVIYALILIKLLIHRPILQSCTWLFCVGFLFDVKFVKAFHIDYGSKKKNSNH
jgi:hypothetical protein